MPGSIWKVTEGSGAYYERYWKETEMEGSTKKDLEA